MILQLQTNRWSCLPTAFAMVLDIPVAELIRLIGHDGSAISRPQAPEPDNHQSFHPQEVIDVAWKLGWAITPFEPHPVSTIGIRSDHHLITFPEGNETRMWRLINGHNGVFTGQTTSGCNHAVAWDCNAKRIYNPNGRIQTIGDFAINTFWIASSMIAQSKS